MNPWKINKPTQPQPPLTLSPKVAALLQCIGMHMYSPNHIEFWMNKGMAEDESISAWAINGVVSMIVQNLIDTGHLIWSKGWPVYCNLVA